MSPRPSVMSAMSAESATSPQTKQTTLSVAKTPTSRPHHASRKRTRSQQHRDRADETDDLDAHDPPVDHHHHHPLSHPSAIITAATEAQVWTDDHERVLRRLCLDHTDQYRPGKEQDFWNMIQKKMDDQFADAFRPVLAHPDVKELDRMFREQSLSRSRQWLLDWQKKASGAIEAVVNGDAVGATGDACANGDGSVNGSRKKRKTTEAPKAEVPEVQLNGEKHEGDDPSQRAVKDGGNFTLPWEEGDGAGRFFFEHVMDFLRKTHLEEASCQDDLMTDFDEMFSKVHKPVCAWGATPTMLWGLIYMVFCFSRDNRSRVLEMEEELEKEQKKRKWNDDVLWSMINSKCSDVSIRATEQLEILRNQVKVDSGADFQQLRTDVVAAVTKYLRVQQDDDMDLPPTPTPPRRSKRRSKKDSPPAASIETNGHGRNAASAGSANSRVAGFEAEVDTALIAQQLKMLIAQREADAQTIEHQKLIILRMDQRLQDLESRVAGVA